MEKRGAIDLSINLLVIIIISLVILGGGITLLYKFISGAEKLQSVLDAKTEQEIERLLLDEGQRVALPKQAVDLFPGDSYVFGVGVLNIHETAQFMMEVTSMPDAESWLLYNQDFFALEENEHHGEGIFVEVPKDAEEGIYVFKVKIICQGCDDNGGEQYGPTQTFTVTVK